MPDLMEYELVFISTQGTFLNVLVFTENMLEARNKARAILSMTDGWAVFNICQTRQSANLTD